MGQKVHPHGFRLGIIYDWESKWFAERDYTTRLINDDALRAKMSEAARKRAQVFSSESFVTNFVGRLL